MIPSTPHQRRVAYGKVTEAKSLVHCFQHNRAKARKEFKAACSAVGFYLGTNPNPHREATSPEMTPEQLASTWPQRMSLMMCEEGLLFWEAQYRAALLEYQILCGQRMSRGVPLHERGLPGKGVYSVTK